MIPMLQYFVRRNRAAEEEFLTMAPIITSLLRQMNYNSYCVTYAHVGYEKESSLPCMLVIASGFVDRDAINIIERVRSYPGRKAIARAFAFEGTNTEFSIDVEEVRAYQQKPQPGSSIGSSASPDSSFSLNCYFRDQNKNNDKVYSLTVHHGVSGKPEPIPLQANPTVTIQQPSIPDLDSSKNHLIETIDSTRSYLQSDRRISAAVRESREHLIASTTNVLDAHLKIDSEFGTVVVSSGLAHVQFEGRTMNEDWALIAVDPSRVGENYMWCDDLRKRPLEGTPHNFCGQYVSGLRAPRIDDDEEEPLVRKWGRKTGISTAPIHLVYSHVKLPGIEGETSEYTITTGVRFSDRGDSGGPVLDMENKLLGMVLGGSDGTPAVLEGHERLGAVWCSYITPIQLILERVALVTGMRLEPILVDLDERERSGEEIQR
jgi:hypothetical protein